MLLPVHRATAQSFQAWQCSCHDYALVTLHRRQKSLIHFFPCNFTLISEYQTTIDLLQPHLFKIQDSQATHILQTNNKSASCYKEKLMPRIQPCFKGISSEGRKTLVQAGHVPSRKWEVTKEKQEGDVTKSRFCLSLTHSGRGKFV